MYIYGANLLLTLFYLKGCFGRTAECWILGALKIMEPATAKKKINIQII